jgi:hypothetical protein
MATTTSPPYFVNAKETFDRVKVWYDMGGTKQTVYGVSTEYAIKEQ